MSAMNDITMADTAAGAQKPGGTSGLLQTPHSDAFAFSDLERRALELYDQLRELELQKSLIEAQESAHVPTVSTLSDDGLQEQLITAQRQAMDAKAKFEIRNRISHNVLVMDPVLKAVHGGEDTEFAEKRILPLLTEHDTLCMMHGSLASKLASTARALGAAEQGNMAANQENRVLSQTLLELAEQMKTQSTQDIEDARLREQVKAVEKEVKESRRRMRTLKGIVSAMIVGSGINWAADEALQELVMSDEEDG
ncbi:hypothetical protein P280DRAFT_504460 [Massarina eburnea CBS 473.64]|uniref:Centromere protein H C-terminal domain-containing protein n=1 Tax=Massarina eburnea CBS 473.64 TaxID=1395130 RepID=A0A6A6SEZ9_9PLEO|nr:hypothetical protein P280DRAFT_504460 [Massarina eburnea CBS 473.64]